MLTSVTEAGGRPFVTDTNVLYRAIRHDAVGNLEAAARNGWIDGDRAMVEALLAFRDANYAATVLVFIAAYVAIVAFSLPGATIATLTGGFLFATFPGALFNVVAATTKPLAGALLALLQPLGSIAGALVAIGTIVAVAVAQLLLAGWSASAQDGPAERPDIVVVYLDDVDPHDARLWRNERRTPTLARMFARSGVQFSSAISETPLCSPGRASTLTGQHTALPTDLKQAADLRPQLPCFGLQPGQLGVYERIH